MKFKFSPEKFNLRLMIFMFILLIFSIVVWFIFREYTYFAVFLILTLISAHMYFMNRYVIDKKYLITYLGFLKIKINYNDIKEVEIKNDKVNIKLNRIILDICPEDSKKFVRELKKKIKENK